MTTSGATRAGWSTSPPSSAGGLDDRCPPYSGPGNRAHNGIRALMKRLDDLDVTGRVVLLRTDLNVPLDGATITDDRRIRASLPSLTALTARGARVVVCAHLGRPRGGNYADRAAGGPAVRPPAGRAAGPPRRPGPLPRAPGRGAGPPPPPPPGA